MRIHPLLLLTSTLLLTLAACTSGGGDGENEAVPNQNACSIIGLNTKIISGAACVEAASPVVRVEIVNQDSTEGLCTGTMLTNKDVLTAAHCFLSHPLQSASISVNGVTTVATSVAVHPQAGVVQNGSEVQVVNDVAIVHLPTALNTSTVGIVTSVAPQSGDIISIYGYGLDENGALDVLRSGQSKITDVTTQHLIALFDGETGSNSCNGDSGGPALLTIQNNGQSVSGIVGVVSSGSNPQCLAGDISLYANVTSPSMLNFILQEVPGAALL